VPDDPDELPTASEVAEVSSPGIGAVPLGRMITGADLHPSGQRLVLRTYVGVHEYVLEAPSALASLVIVPPTLVALGPLSEPQGEAVAYDGTGSGLFTVSEDPDGAPHQPLHHYPCN